MHMKYGSAITKASALHAERGTTVKMSLLFSSLVIASKMSVPWITDSQLQY